MFQNTTGMQAAVAATALLPLSHALTGSLRPYVPADQLAAIDPDLKKAYDAISIED